ncbi:MAG: AAA family ATPase [Pseudomonadota bacterium]
MRITHITASHFLNHRSLNIPVDPEARVLLIAGNNGSGKTGLAQGVRLALTGEPVRGLKHKNQMTDLITQGEKDGLFAVTIQDGDNEHVYRLSLKTGNYSGSSPELPGSWYPLDPEAFIALPDADRRKLLFKLAGIQLKPEMIIKELIDAGHEVGRVETVAGSLRQGFDATAAAAKNAATEARGGWKAITGETYGSSKGASWVAPVPTSNVGSVSDLEKAVHQAQTKADELKAAAELLRSHAAAHLAAQSASTAKAALATNEAALGELSGQRDELATELEGIRKAAQYKGGTTCKCPQCDTLLYWNTVGVLLTWDEAKPPMAAPQASAMISTVEQQLADLDRKLDRVKHQVAEGRAAQKLLDNLPPVPAAGATRDADTAAGQALAALAMANADLNAARNASQQAAQADERTAKAARYHADVDAYGKLADAITELPAKYLSHAIKQVQGLLDEAASAYGTAVTLGEDMDLYYGTVPYGLASDSQQWRLRAAIGYALAIVGGLGVVVLDKFDVLEVKSRGAILGWLTKQTQVQVILCGTLKELPKLPEPPFQLVWLEGKP